MLCLFCWLECLIAFHDRCLCFSFFYWSDQLSPFQLICTVFSYVATYHQCPRLGSVELSQTHLTPIHFVYICFSPGASSTTVVVVGACQICFLKLFLYVFARYSFKKSPVGFFYGRLEDIELFSFFMSIMVC